MELIKVSNLRKVFPKHKTAAVDGVDFSVFKGEVLGLVGESGCGKSTLGRSILRLTDAQEGRVLYKNEDLLKVSKPRMRGMRKDLQMIFQDPYTSLDPRMRIGETLEEALIIHENLSGKKRIARVIEILEMVGLGEAYLRRFPSELSGGERQRVGIGRALATDPEFIVCDEPVSSLDISIQAQILNLLMDLQKAKNLTYLFISHDLGVIASICDRVIVMQSGKFIERNSCEEIFKNPKQEYTKRLLDSAF
ncbi:MAG: dipeptide/oligopeptide/nickel ABC transporter ATP-binding protein [Candidatus Omnitrophica bacterium]|nr:dipeptide/oligopeptide/nickel ABC transporter ATP-binding protein [Candidatus Omnitrophota bacterium]